VAKSGSPRAGFGYQVVVLRAFSRRLTALEVASLLVAAVSLFAALGSPLWDPPEVEAAELARRIAQGLFGAGGLEDGERVPTRGELGRGELPFLAMATGFRVFGLEPWAARLPLAVFGAAGAAALFVAVRRLASSRAACVAVLALSTTPLYYLQARALVGDITTLSAVVLGLAGHALFVFEERALGRRLTGAALALLGAVIGFFSRGPLLGVAPAALGVGGTWLALVLSGETGSRATRRAGAVTLAVGLSALASGGYAWLATPPDRYSFWIGTARSAYPHPTFEAGLRQFFHAGFPWSALALPALASVIGGARREPSPSPRSKLCFAAVVTAAAAWALETALAPAFGPLPGSGLPMLAIVVGVALDERPPEGSRGLAGAVALAIAALLAWDYFHHPDKLLAAVGAPPGTLPETWDPSWFGLGALAALAAFGLAALFLHEPAGDDGSEFSARDYAAWFSLLREWRGGLALYGLVAVVASALGLDLALALGSSRGAQAATVLARWSVRAVWLAALFAACAPVLWYAARDAARLAVRVLRVERGSAAAWVLASLGLAGSLALAPALWLELPANAAFDAYRKRATPGDELGLLHGALPAARYERGVRTTALSGVDETMKFLETRSGARRFVAFEPSELGALNAAYRARRTPRRNLPVVDTPGGAWLAVDSLARSELDLNPLRGVLFDAPPAPAARELDAELGHALGLVGWELRDREGVLRSEVIAGEWYDLYLYFEVRARLDRAWRIFVHVDGFQQRFNADHEPIGAAYPSDSWLPGDWLVDRHRSRLDAELSPGNYSVYTGMHVGEERLPVTRGSAGEDRVFLGALRVD